MVKNDENKLGISGEDKEDKNIVNDLLINEKNSVDFTNTFSDLTYEKLGWKFLSDKRL